MIQTIDSRKWKYERYIDEIFYNAVDKAYKNEMFEIISYLSFNAFKIKEGVYNLFTNGVLQVNTDYWFKWIAKYYYHDFLRSNFKGIEITILEELFPVEDLFYIMYLERFCK